MKKLILLFSIVLLLGCNTEVPTEVLVLPTLHKAHESNENYTYDHLMEMVKKYDPDIIAVEIRPEDIELQSDVLEIFYPQEMITVRDTFRERVAGIDFYSEETQDQKVRLQMFRDTTTQLGKFNHLSQEMKMDSVLVVRRDELGLDQVTKEQERIAYSYSPADFLKGEYDSLVELQFKLEDSLLQGTPYEEYAVFNNRRDRRITQNALRLIEANPEKKILILIGASHRNRLVDFLEKEDPGKVKLVKELYFLEE